MAKRFRKGRGLVAIVGDRAFEAFPEVDLGVVVEEFLGLRDVGVGVVHVARTRVVVDGVDVGAEQVVEGVDEFVDGDAAATADVERFAGDVALGGEDVRLDGVIDEGEVAGLLAVAVDDGTLAVEHEVDELRDDRSVVAVGVLARAEDVEVPERGRVDVVEVAELERELLGVVLRERVGRFWLGLHRLDFGESVGRAVHRRGGGDDGRIDIGFAGRVQDCRGAGAVGVGGRDGVVDAPRDRGDRSLVEHVVDAVGGVGHRVRVTDVRLVERERSLVLEWIEVLLAPGREIVDATDVVAAVEQRLGEIRSDEPRDAGDECSGHTSAFPRVGMGLSTSNRDVSGSRAAGFALWR